MRAEVVAAQRPVRAPVAAEQAAREHAVGRDADAQLAHGGQDLLLDAAREQRVLDLDVGDRVHGGRAPDRLRADLGQADVPHVAGLTSSAMAPTVSSIGTSGSRRAGR